MIRIDINDSPDGGFQIEARRGAVEITVYVETVEEVAAAVERAVARLRQVAATN